MSDPCVDLALTINHETDAAWLVTDGDVEVWLPKSRCTLVESGKELSTFNVPEWLATEKGLV